jgi:transcriptional regulator with XRE-family HTH domain
MDSIISDKEREAIRKGFGDLVRYKRNELGWSQEELAFQAGLHRTYIGHVERAERNLSLESIYVLAKALRCHPRELLPN